MNTSVVKAKSSVAIASLLSTVVNIKCPSKPCGSDKVFLADTIKGVVEVGFEAPDIVLSTVIELLVIAVITPANFGELSISFT